MKTKILITIIPQIGKKLVLIDTNDNTIIKERWIKMRTLLPDKTRRVNLEAIVHCPNRSFYNKAYFGRVCFHRSHNEEHECFGCRQWINQVAHNSKRRSSNENEK